MIFWLLQDIIKPGKFRCLCVLLLFHGVSVKGVCIASSADLPAVQEDLAFPRLLNGVVNKRMSCEHVESIARFHRLFQVRSH